MPDDVVLQLGDTGAVDETRAADYIRQRRGEADTYGQSFAEIAKQRRAAIDEARATLDRTIAELRERHSGGAGGVNLPLLALGVGLLQGAPPGTVSNFGQELGRGLSSMGQTIRAQRMSDVDFTNQIARLQQAQAQLADQPLADEAKELSGRRALAEKNAADIEKALIKGSGSAGADPAKLKILAQVNKERAAAGLPPMTVQEYDREQAELRDQTTSPADIKELRAENENRRANGQPPLTLLDYKSMKANKAALGKTQGAAQGAAQVGLPGMLDTADEIVRDLDKMKNHPGLPAALGIRSYLPSIRGSDRANFEAIRDRVIGQQFLIAYEKLRGAQAITDIEGEKATAAMANLKNTQSPESYRESLETLRRVVQAGVDNLKARASGQAFTGAPPAAAPAPGKDGSFEVYGQDGKKYRGLLKDGQWSLEPVK